MNNLLLNFRKYLHNHFEDSSTVDFLLLYLVSLFKKKSVNLESCKINSLADLKQFRILFNRLFSSGKTIGSATNFAPNRTSCHCDDEAPYQTVQDKTISALPLSLRATEGSEAISAYQTEIAAPPVYPERSRRTRNDNNTKLMPLSLYYFGQFLTASSFYTDNPAEKPVNMQSISSASSNRDLRELLEFNKRNRLSLLFNYLEELNFRINFQPKVLRLFTCSFSLAAITFVLAFLINPNHFYRIKSNGLNQSFLSLIRVKPVNAKETGNTFGSFNSLFDEDKIVSSSAKRVTNTYKTHD